MSDSSSRCSSRRLRSPRGTLEAAAEVGARGDSTRALGRTMPWLLLAAALRPPARALLLLRRPTLFHDDAGDGRLADEGAKLSAVVLLAACTASGVLAAQVATAMAPAG